MGMKNVLNNSQNSNKFTKQFQLSFKKSPHYIREGYSLTIMNQRKNVTQR